MSGHEQKAIRSLNTLKTSHRRLQYATLSALIWFHERYDLQDEDELSSLRLSLSVAEKCANIEGLLLSSDFHIHVGNVEEAQEILDANYFDMARPCDQTNANEEALNIEEQRIRLQLKLHSVDDEGDSQDREFLDVITNAKTKSIDTIPVIDYLMLRAK